VKIIIDREFRPDGYNVGVNIGEAGGQSIPHLHIHVIPRYKGDMENPRGGVRGVIPHKQKYVRKTRGN
jgi:diadenosine tetraphosphate (Ap4A) HIT family hydrolase